MRHPITLVVLAAVMCAGGTDAPRAQAARVSPALRAAVAAAGDAGRVTTWVYFTDKGGDSAQQLREAEQRLTPHARARRARNRGADRLVDAYDIPVAAAYIAAVRARALRVRQVSRWLNALSIEAAPVAVDEIAALPFVARMDLVRVGRAPLPEPVEATRPLAPPSARATTALDYGGSFAQNDQINIPALHDLGYAGNGVMICMLDAGFNNLAHPAFAQIDILITRDFVNGDSVVADEPGEMGTGNHGTYTLGAIGGFAPGDLIGPAWGATYILGKTENTDWERHMEEDAWVAGAEWADSIGADIISSSLTYSIGFTHGELDYAWQDMDGATAIATIGADIAGSRGILVVSSAGNDGSVAAPANTLGAPCDGDSVLAIGAVDVTGARASFSSVGYSADGRVKPDLMAMGVSVRTANPFAPTGYVDVGGTSLSCPLVAGSAALLMEARPDATNAEIMNALRQTASQAGAPDRLYGFGIVDAAAAASYLSSAVAEGPPSRGETLLAYPNPFNPATTIAYTIPARARVTLAVFDVRGTRVATLVDEEQSPGRHAVTWNARDPRGAPLASGVYLVRLDSAASQQRRKIVLVK
jgi:hypothetical protein